ncbi:hypothetical protein Salat_0838400 [Sesamum alatum]|uniref:Zinc knuckle CX2CX4HX4C domain-containing protein n=1 Tax=Sesamum alatum TaxID=300844 RepID=A0AAE1YIL2_9LAMI|nr:hypothetical protein Salat_0838400 [Sesamum alatum]
MESDILKLDSALSLTADEASGVVIPQSDWSKGLDGYGLTLVGPLLSHRSVHFEALKWQLLQLFQVARGATMRKISKSRFCLVFNHIEDLRRTLDLHPWVFERNLVVLSPLAQHDDPLTIPLEWCPFFIHIHDLGYGQRSVEVIRRIGNYLGAWLDADKVEDDISWFENVRVRLNINVSLPLKCALRLQSESGESVIVKFSYECLPNFCYLCGKLAACIWADEAYGGVFRLSSSDLCLEFSYPSDEGWCLTSGGSDFWVFPIIFVCFRRPSGCPSRQWFRQLIDEDVDISSLDRVDIANLGRGHGLSFASDDLALSSPRPLSPALSLGHSNSAMVAHHTRIQAKPTSVNSQSEMGDSRDFNPSLKVGEIVGPVSSSPTLVDIQVVHQVQSSSMFAVGVLGGGSERRGWGRVRGRGRSIGYGLQGGGRGAKRVLLDSLTGDVLGQIQSIADWIGQLLRVHGDPFSLLIMFRICQQSIRTTLLSLFNLSLLGLTLLIPLHGLSGLKYFGLRMQNVTKLFRMFGLGVS